jgi:hypothetical protein
MERIKLAAVLLALVTAVGISGCQRESPSNGQGGAQSEQPQPEQPMERGGTTDDTTGAPSGGAMGGSSGESGAGAPPSGTQ